MDRKAPAMPTDTGPDHDHSRCIDRSRRAAVKLCAERGLRLTPVRAAVLDILLEEHRALGAYELLDRLKAQGHAAQPPVAYRALDVLMKTGLVHRIEHLNAYVACICPDEAHAPAFAVCRECRSVSEDARPDASPTALSAAKGAGFSVETTIVEAIGLCPDCDAGQAR